MNAGNEIRTKRGLAPLTEPIVARCHHTGCVNYPMYGRTGANGARERSCDHHLWADYRADLDRIKARMNGGQGPDVAAAPAVRDPDVGVITRPAQGKLL